MPPLHPIDADAAHGKLTFARDTGFHGEVKRRVLATSSAPGCRSGTARACTSRRPCCCSGSAPRTRCSCSRRRPSGRARCCRCRSGSRWPGIGFGIQHDANHGAYSSRAAVNRLMGMTLDMLGASSYLWRFKHNLSHHTYTNLAGADDDINFLPFARLSPAQPRFACITSSNSICGRSTGSCSRSGTSSTTSRALTQARISGHAFPRPRGALLRRADRGQAAVHRLGVRDPAAVPPVVGRAAVLRHDIARPRHHAGRGVHARPLRGGGGVSRAAAGDGATAAPVGGAPGPDHRRLRARQSAADLVRGRAQLPDRASPVSAHLPRPLPAHRGDRAGGRAPSSASVTPRTHSFSGALASHWRWLRRMGRVDTSPGSEPVSALAQGAACQCSLELRLNGVDVPPPARALAVVVLVGVVRNSGRGRRSRPDVQGGGSLAGNEPQPACRPARHP